MQKDICRKLTGVAIPPSKYDLFLTLSQLGPPLLCFIEISNYWYEAVGAIIPTASVLRHILP